MKIQLEVVTYIIDRSENIVYTEDSFTDEYIFDEKKCNDIKYKVDIEQYIIDTIEDNIGGMGQHNYYVKNRIMDNIWKLEPFEKEFDDFEDSEYWFDKDWGMVADTSKMKIIMINEEKC